MREIKGEKDMKKSESDEWKCMGGKNKTKERRNPKNFTPFGCKIDFSASGGGEII